MNTNFYVSFCFMIKKTTTNYCWILRQLKDVYTTLNISYFTVFVIDNQLAMIS
jgi:hypothetical protein